MTVRQEPVKIIQMISAPVSFLSLAWAFTAYDSAKSDIFVGRNVKQKVFLFANYLFVLSSRLFAIAFFTITYKWWIISVLMIHTVLLLIADKVWSSGVVVGFDCCFSCLNLIFDVHWLRDDISVHWLRYDISYGPRIDEEDLANIDEEEARVKQRMFLLSNILFVIENCTMILTFYRFSPFSNT